MKLFRIPYRWSLKTFWENVSFAGSDLRNGVRNICRWLPIIWFDADYDWDGLGAVMEQKLRWMADSAKRWYHEGAEEERKDMLACAEAIHRLREDDYFTEKDGYNLEEEKKDEELFAQTIKKMRCWWD